MYLWWWWWLFFKCHEGLVACVLGNVCILWVFPCPRLHLKPMPFSWCRNSSLPCCFDFFLVIKKCLCVCEGGRGTTVLMQTWICRCPGENKRKSCGNYPHVENTRSFLIRNLPSACVHTIKTRLFEKMEETHSVPFADVIPSFRFLFLTWVFQCSTWSRTRSVCECQTHFHV